jgi:hypothetical protein
MKPIQEGTQGRKEEIPRQRGIREMGGDKGIINQGF